MQATVAILFVVVSLIIIRCYPRSARAISVIYILAVIYLTFISREPKPDYIITLQPFRAARLAVEIGGLRGFFENGVRIVKPEYLTGIILNVLLFVPLGYLIPTLSTRCRRWYVALLVGILASVVIEVTQLITRLGWCDLEDVVNNTFGSLIGYGLYNKFPKA